MIDDENTSDFYNAYLLKYVKLACTLRTDVSFVQDSLYKYFFANCYLYVFALRYVPCKVFI